MVEGDCLTIMSASWAVKVLSLFLKKIINLVINFRDENTIISLLIHIGLVLWKQTKCVTCKKNLPFFVQSQSVSFGYLILISLKSIPSIPKLCRYIKLFLLIRLWVGRNKFKCFICYVVWKSLVNDCICTMTPLSYSITQNFLWSVLQLLLKSILSPTYFFESVIYTPLLLVSKGDPKPSNKSRKTAPE